MKTRRWLFGALLLAAFVITVAEAGCLGPAPPLRAEADDGGPATDALVDGGPLDGPATIDANALTDGGNLSPPRQIAPLSTASVTSGTPTLRWSLPTGIDGALVEICKERACANIEETIAVKGDRVRPQNALSRGIHYWRVRGIAASAVGSNTGPTWQIVVGRTSAPVDTSSGSTTDFDLDGRADIAIAALAGSTYVYSGSAAGVGSRQTLTHDTMVNSEYMAVAARAGDLDGDGYPDLAVGAYCGLGPGCAPTSNHVLIYKGGPDGLTRGISDGGAQPSVVLAQPAGAAGDPFQAADAGATARFGFYVLGPGDVDGDGYADLLIAAPGWANNVGRVFFYKGGPQATTTPGTLQPIADGVGGNVALGPLGAAGDVDGDGYADFLLYEVNSSDQHVQLWFGGPSGPDAVNNRRRLELSGMPSKNFGIPHHSGDLNGDGYSDIVIGAPGAEGDGSAAPGNLHIFYGGLRTTFTQPTTSALTFGSLLPDHAFGGALSYAGDLDGDGFDDLLVAAYGGYDQFPAVTGSKAFAIFGAAGAPTRSVPLPPPAAPHDVSFDYSAWGFALDSPGDVDGDGFPDAVICATESDSVDTVAFAECGLYRGGVGGLVTSPTSTFHTPGKKPTIASLSRPSGGT